MKYKLIFMDINMPVMDGFEASRRICEFFKERGHVCEIIALTGYQSKNIEKKCLEHGMTKILNKPASLDDIDEAIRNHLMLS